MTKNKLEKKFSESLKNSPINFWGMKLHCNPMAHQNTPADYIISYQKDGVAFLGSEPLDIMLVECKQVTCKEGKGRLTFKRLKQMHDLLAFANKFERHHAYFCVAFYDKRWANSEVYLIPVEEMFKIVQYFQNEYNQKSLNREQMLQQFAQYKCSMYKKYISLFGLI